MKKYVVSSILALALTACNEGPVKLRIGDDPAPSNQKAQAATVGFDEVNQAVFAVSCQKCHSREKPILATYADYKANMDKIRSEVVSRSMPKKGTPLTDAQITLVTAWVDGGGVETIPGKVIAPPTPPPTKPIDPTAPVTWQQVNERIVIKSCASCHYVKNPDGLSTYEDIKTVRATIGTFFYTAVISPVMPPPPADWDQNTPNPNQLSDVDKRLLSEWIIQGMKE